MAFTVVLGCIATVVVKKVVLSKYANPPPNEIMSEADLRSDEKVLAMESAANRILLGLRKACADFRLIFEGPIEFKADKGQITYTTYDDPKVELDSKERHFSFQKLTGNLAVYILWSAGGIDEKPSDTDQSTWSVDRAVQVGTAFRSVLLDGRNLKFGLPTTKFDAPFGAGENYHQGYWTIYWSMIDERGRPFGGDGVKVQISERYGLKSATTYLDDYYVPQIGEPMAVASAIAIAKKNHPAMGTDSKTISDYSLKSAELELIRPSGLERKSCRLAWVIWLWPQRSPVPPPGPTYDDSQEVTVDAITGDILGTNCML